MTKDVLVVGAGPAGLAVAHELTRHGVEVRIIDAADGPTTTSRAIAIHARTLEIFDQMGILGQVLPLGLSTDAFSMHRKGRQMVRFGPEYSRLPTRFPFTLLIEQTSTERVLREALERRGVHVEWGTRLEGLTQGSGEVAATLVTADGPPTRIGTPWLVGCDGGHSTVRKLLRLPLIGDSHETWLIADATIDMDVPRDSLHWLAAGSGTVMAVPLPEPGKWRLLDTVDIDDGPEVAERFAAKLSAGFGINVKVHPPSWVSVFTIQQRMITSMRAGRCLVAGDAAHVHSPASGQGMNTGLQEAFNLAWKLAMVAKGQADEDLLDSYSAERVPIGRDLLGATRKATALVTLTNAVATAVMPAAFTVIRNVPALRRRIERKIMQGMTGLAIAYRHGSLTTSPAPGARRPPGARPGERLIQITAHAAESPGWQEVLAALREPCWTLLMIGPDSSDVPVTDDDWLSVRRPADPDGRLTADLGAGWLLVRPDGYLAARGTGTPVLPRLRREAV